MLKNLGMIGVCMIWVTSVVFGAVDASSLQVKVYRFAVSTNADCSSPVEIFNNTATATYEEFVGSSPEIGSGDLAHGTYNCAIIEMSDTIKYLPVSNLPTVGDVVCDASASTPYSLDICGSHGPGDTFLSYDNIIAGSTTETECTASEETITMYVSTISEYTGGDSPEGLTSFLPPTTAKKHGLILGAALVVAADTTAQFVIDASDTIENKVDGESTPYCEMSPPEFSFELVE